MARCGRTQQVRARSGRKQFQLVLMVTALPLCLPGLAQSGEGAALWPGVQTLCVLRGGGEVGLRTCHVKERTQISKTVAAGVLGERHKRPERETLSSSCSAGGASALLHPPSSIAQSHENHAAVTAKAHLMKSANTGEQSLSHDLGSLEISVPELEEEEKAEREAWRGRDRDVEVESASDGQAHAENAGAERVLGEPEWQTARVAEEASAQLQVARGGSC